MPHTTLCYGTVPSFEAFKEAFDRECPHYVYELDVRGTDARMFADIGLGNGAGHYSVSVQSLYALLDQLGAIAEGHISHGVIPWSDEQREWAGDFASSILTTLGFEWV